MTPEYNAIACQLEAYIDQLGAGRMIEMMAAICWEKGKQLRQDPGAPADWEDTAADWENAATRLEAVWPEIEV